MIDDRRAESSAEDAAPEPQEGTPPEGAPRTAGAPEQPLLKLEGEELVRALEAVLFASRDPLPVRTLAELFEVGVHDIREAAEKLRDEYLGSDHAFRLEDVAGGLILLTLPRYDPWVRKLHRRQREARLSAAALETLAVIAYKQPITKADLEAIRGVQCGPILKTLLDRGLIRVVGRDDSLGKPLLYGTTRRFLESFGLESLRDLPQPEMKPAAPSGPGPINN